MAYDPRVLTFEEWVGYTSSDLTQFGYVPIVCQEEDWQTWAATVLHLPALAAVRTPDPRQFESWQDWAHQFNQGLRTIGL